jgi:hypothetical protein
VLQTALCDLSFGFALLRHETLQKGAKQEENRLNSHTGLSTILTATQKNDLPSFTTETTVYFKLRKKNGASAAVLQSDRKGWHGPTKAQKQATIDYNEDKTLPRPDEVSFRIA